LDLLGEKIELLGWPHHSGGLDTQSMTEFACLSLSFACNRSSNPINRYAEGRSGTHSIYTRWKEEEIMFHVSTLLPLYKKDPQQLERKKHIGILSCASLHPFFFSEKLFVVRSGNDRVVIIFKDGDAPHPPDSIASKTNRMVASSSSWLAWLSDPLFCVFPLFRNCYPHPGLHRS